MPGRPRSIARSLAAVCLTLVMAAALDCRTGLAAEQSQPPPSGQASPPRGQIPPPAPPPADRPLRLFVDCSNVSCDTEFFRTEITFVDHVRDRRDADLHVLVTGQETGGGGREYSVAFIGLGRFDKVDHTMRYVSKATDTDDDRRRGLLASLKLGLVRYVADTPAGHELQISHKKPAAAPGAAGKARDPWDFWVFSASLQNYMNGEASRTSVSLYGTFTANRVTEEWKVQTSLDASYSESHYTFSEGDTFDSLSRSSGAYALIVNSLGAHWAAGGRASVSSSTYLNQDLKVRLAPAIEYNVFPYSESTRRQLTFNYSAGVNRFKYRETTIYDRDEETIPDEALLVSLDLRQPWGTTSTSFQASHHLNDLKKSRLVFYGDVDVRIFKGFSITGWGNVSRIRDQTYLPKGEATTEEVLVRQRQLATSYDYYISLGIRYRFGSIFNNVVNSRFNGF